MFLLGSPDRSCCAPWTLGPILYCASLSFHGRMTTMQGKHLASAGVVALVLAVWSGTARASSHSDAPLIKLDPQANLTDVYAFIGTSAGGVKSLNVLIAVRP